MGSRSRLAVDRTQARVRAPRKETRTTEKRLHPPDGQGDPSAFVRRPTNPMYQAGKSAQKDAAPVRWVQGQARREAHLGPSARREVSRAGNPPKGSPRGSHKSSCPELVGSPRCASDRLGDGRGKGCLSPGGCWFEDSWCGDGGARVHGGSEAQRSGAHDSHTRAFSAKASLRRRGHPASALFAHTLEDQPGAQDMAACRAQLPGTPSSRSALLPPTSAPGRTLTNRTPVISKS